MQITIREPGSALTHLAAMLITVGASLPLLMKASVYGTEYVISMLIYVLSLVLLYGASAAYHAINVSQAIIKIFRKLDHSMIFVLIAGSYTPVCVLILPMKFGVPLLIAVWSLAVIGIMIKILWINCPKWLSSTIYIAIGWLALFVFGPIFNSLSYSAFFWLVIGGVIYTFGGILYAMKFSGFNKKHPYFGSHEIFHLFVMAGSFCHFVFMYQYLLE